MIRKCLAAIAAAFVLATAPLATAAAIVGAMHEPFDYAAATQFGSNSANNGGQGWNTSGSTLNNAATANWGSTTIVPAGAAHGGTAAAKTATSPGLTSTATGYLAGSGNKLTLNDPLTASASQNIGRLLGGQTVDSGTLYFSYLTEKNNDTVRSINLAFFNTSGERLAIGQINGAVTTNGTIGLLPLAANANLQNAATPIPYGINVTHLIIGKIEFDAVGLNERVSLWVDPADVTTEALAGATYIQYSAADFVSITAIRPFVGSTQTGAPSSSADFDEIRLGGTWESVTSQRVPIGVPEPASVTLAIGLAGAALALGRRR